MKKSPLVCLSLFLLVFGFAKELYSDQSSLHQVSPLTEISLTSNDDTKKIEVTLTPTEPHLLPDLSSKLTITKKTSGWDRGGFPQVINKNLTLDIVPNTVIASGGYLFYLTLPHEYKFGREQKSDMRFSVVESCKCTVLAKKSKAPLVQLKALKKTLPFAAKHAACNQLKGVNGKGKHFVALRVTRTEIYRKHPSPVLGTGMDIIVVNNFGSKKIRLEYNKKETVTIGPETITLESLNFHYPTKTVDIEVITEPKEKEAQAVIVEYSDAKPAKDAPSADADRILDVKKAEKKEIRHSMIGFRNTLIFYTFKDQQAILTLLIDNKDETFPVKGKIHVFAEATTENGLKNWVNNQYSDARRRDVPIPLLTKNLPEGSCTVTSHKKTGTSENRRSKEPFNNFDVKLSVKEHLIDKKIIDEEIKLSAFTDTAKVHVKSK